MNYKNVVEKLVNDKERNLSEIFESINRLTPEERRAISEYLSVSTVRRHYRKKEVRQYIGKTYKRSKPRRVKYVEAHPKKIFSSVYARMDRFKKFIKNEGSSTPMEISKEFNCNIKTTHYTLNRLHKIDPHIKKERSGGHSVSYYYTE